MADSPYRSPILASIFRGFGWLSLAGTVFVLISSLIAYSESRRGISDVETSTALYLVFVPSAGGLFITLLLFGIGQVIDFIGRIAFHSAEIYDLLERADTQATARWRDMQKALDGAVAHGRRIAANTAPLAPAAPSEFGRSAEPPMSGPLTRYYYVDPDFQVAGPVSKQQLRSLADGGQIGGETMVCPEGGTEWKPLSESVAFGPAAKLPEAGKP